MHRGDLHHASFILLVARCITAQGTCLIKFPLLLYFWAACRMFAGTDLQRPRTRQPSTNRSVHASSTTVRVNDSDTSLDRFTQREPDYGVPPLVCVWPRRRSDNWSIPLLAGRRSAAAWLL
ncbi:hypothetical protein V8C35DRAFT_305251 [Trichoderma chlorosporum]